MRKALLPLALSLPLAMSMAGAAHAVDDAATLQASLGPLNGSGASGSATVVVTGNTATVSIDSTGMVADVPHAQHFHIGGTNTCPTEAADDNDDGRISTPEGQPSYGPINVSLTTEGDTSPDSALAVDRMPIAGSDGDVSYHRTLDVSDDVAADLRAGKAVIVQHGVDYNDNGEYDGAESPVDPSLPAEATNPATCGELNPVPAAAEAGGGGAAGAGTNYGIAGLGAAVLAAAAAGVWALRRARATR